MTFPLPADAIELWRDAGLDDLTLRPLAPADLDAAAAALLPGEGYSLPGALDHGEVRADLEGFGGDGARQGLAVVRGYRLVAFLLFVERDRDRDPFPEGSVLAELPRHRFTPDGRLLQVHDLWVHADVRRRGVATALKRVLERIAAARGVGMIYTVTESTHAIALSLNARLGYVELYRGPMWDQVERVGLAKYLPGR